MIRAGLLVLTWGISFLFFLLPCGCDTFHLPSSGKEKLATPSPSISFVDNLYALSAAGGHDVWTVGYYGAVYHSADGGHSWKRQASNTKSELFDVVFINPQRGWIVGRHGTILHTRDGGATWQAQASPTTSTLYKVAFVDEHSGWIAGYGVNGIILHTSDGGASWIVQKEDEDRIYNSISFADVSHGWVVGEYGTIYHTFDGGNTWLKQDGGVGTVSLYGVFFKDQRKGWVVGMDGIMIATEDGGSTWSKRESGTAKHLYSIRIIGENGFAVGTRGAFIVSVDGGESWQEREHAIPSRYWLMDVAFSEDAKQGLMVGAHGTVLRTGDEGTTWEMVSGMSISE